jgi:dnd system-associated protein 4
MSEINRSDRLRYPSEVKGIYDCLSGGKDIETSPFPQKKDLFMAAAYCGFQKGNRIPLPAGSKEQIRMEVFSLRDQNMMKAIALVETKEVAVLGNLGNVLTIVEEYAFGGIRDLETRLVTGGEKALWNLVGEVLGAPK